MRFRIETKPPLPDVKAWFSFPQPGDTSNTLYDLKVSLCKHIKALKDAQTLASRFQLVMDEFDLLDELQIDGLLKEGDLITARAVAQKRKAETDGAPTAKKRKLDSESSNSSSSLSSSSSSYSSSDESDSESDSSVSSASSSSSSPPVRVRKPNISSNLPPNQLHVPPGLGSARTQSRNRRRRLKRKFDSLTKEDALSPSVPPEGTSQANLLPLGPRKSETKLIAEEPALTMFSLGNKNKKKGYKQTLAPPSSSKIVFSQSGNTVDQKTLNTPRFVPPSERYAEGRIPKNMFVTSVDVEEGLWSRKKKGKADAVEVQEGPSIKDVVTLDYGDPEPSETNIDEKTWTNAEAAFHAMKPLGPLDSLALGQLLAWKELALNPVTYTPEIMLNLATVVECSPAEQTITIRKHIRPGYEEDAEEEAQILDEVLTWARASEQEWKMVST